MTKEEAKVFLINISYKLGNMAIEYLTEKDGEKMREAIEVLEQEPKTDTWSIQEVADTLKKHGLIVEQEPCEDAISRQRVLDVINLNWDYRRNCIRAIENLPSVNPQESKTGHWINQDEGAFYPIECSECHKEPLLDSYGDYVFSNYCPVCGAKMIEPQDKDIIWYDKRNYSEIVVKPQESEG